MSAQSRLQQLLDRIDDLNRQDPNLEQVDQQNLPKALVYGHRMSSMLAEFAPGASEELQIAARAQHIERWRIPRNDYPMNRPGYLKRRRELGQFHADRTCTLMNDFGYGQESLATVAKLLTKQGIKQDEQVQILEDIVCLVFVNYYITDFAANQEPDKLANIIRKTWAKMSAQGQAKLLTLNIDPVLKTTLEKALAD